MSENTTAQSGTTPETGGKTFSQDDVNRIVQERLARERDTAAASIAEREQELTRREFLLEAKTTLTTKGLPADLLDALNTSSPEAFQRSLDLFETHAKEKARLKPPPYAPGTGSSPMYGGAADDAIKGAFRPKI